MSAQRLEIQKGQSVTFRVTLVNKTSDTIPADISGVATILFPTKLITGYVSFSSNMAEFNLTPAQTDVKPSSYKASIAITNSNGAYKQFIPFEILVKDQFDE